MKRAHGMTQASMLKKKTTYRIILTGSMTLPTLSNSRMIDALARGRIGVLMRLKARRT